MAYNQAIFEGFFAVLFGLFLNTRARYGILLYRIHSATKSNISKKRALKIILPYQSYHESLNTLKLPTLTERRESLCMRFYKKTYCDTSSKLFELLPKPINHEHNLRHARNIPLFKSHTKRFSDSVFRTA